MSRLRFPHPLTLLVAGVFIATALTYVLPAGEFERREDSATGRRVVVAGTYHAVPRAPVGPFQALVAIPKGIADAVSVICLVFIAGGAFTVVDKTGALRHGVDWLAKKLERREALVIPVVSLAFAVAGALEHLQEEIIALIPVLLVLTRRVGFDALTAAAMSIGAAAVGAAFSPMDPFQVGIAQKLAQLPLLSGSAFRLVFLALAVGIWIWGTIRHALRIRTTPHAASATAAPPPPPPPTPFGPRQGIVLAIVLLTFVVFVYGVMVLGWDFDQMSALFFLMGVLAGLIGGLRFDGTATAFVEGFASMAFAGMVIGFARAIYVVLAEGHVIDTIVQGLFTPIAHLPVALSAVGMMAVHTLVHVPVPSVSGQAVLTMPILVPLSDLLGLSRQVTVLAYQYGAGLCELLTPTNGALMAIIAAAGVRYEQWLWFLLPLYAALAGLGVVAIGIGIAVGLR